MDLKDPKTQKLALVVLGFFLVIYFWYSRVYTTNDAELTAKRSNYESIMTDLTAVELKAKSLEGLKSEYDALLNRYEKIEMLLPEEKQVPKFLIQLHSATGITQSRLTELEPISTKSTPYYAVSDYKMRFMGTYHELGEFLATVANFPFITNVSRVKIDGLPEASLQGDQDKRSIHDTRSLEASMVLSTYFVSPEHKLNAASR